MQFFSFLRNNARWLAGGMALTYFSSFGQTFFVSLSAGGIREEYGLSHGGWGGLYMLATLGSALTLPLLGQSVDKFPIWKVCLVTILMLSVACLSMAWSTHVAMLALTVYFLRLFGQGMMTHIAMTSMGKWYAANRGRAVSIAAIGVNIGEATLPLVFVIIAAALGWRNAWVAGAGALLIVALPLIVTSMSKERQPHASDPDMPASTSRNWTRGEVLRDPLFYVMLVGVLAPPFIGTTIFFHQVYLTEIRGWELQAFAASFAIMSVTVVSFALLAGYLVDRFSALRLLPIYLIPLALACLVLGLIEAQWAVFAFMFLLGISYGFSTTLFGALWPELYGTAHLGAVRSGIIATMVFATALGPGVTGVLIDFGVPYPLQITVMGLYCLAATIVMALAARAAARRKSLEPVSDTAS